MQSLHHPSAGPYRTTGFPFRLGGGAVVHRGPAPALGQHSREVLAEVGLNEVEVDGLLATGVVIG